jgi:hypothetical protein
MLIAMGATLGLYGLGRSVTPRTAAGRPILYSPEVRAAEVYRRQVTDQVEQFDQLSQHLTDLLTASGDLYEQSTRVNQALDQAVNLAQAVEVSSVPAIMAELQQMLFSAAQAYLSAAQSVAAWFNAPTPENQQTAAEALAQAQAAVTAVRQSRWLTTGE